MYNLEMEQSIDSNKKIRIGINGFGRIGRAITRNILNSKNFELLVVNDLEEDIKNLEYLLKYDSVYGKINSNVNVFDSNMVVNNHKIRFYNYKSTKEVPWDLYSLDVLVEATGVDENVRYSRKLINSGIISKVIVTNSSKHVDHTIIFGVNEKTYNSKEHSLISSSICDANAIVPILHYLDEAVGVESALITTLHPWLSYQNLLDGTVKSISSPGHSWQDYSLGRSSVGNLILKDTTATAATLNVMPKLKGAVEAISFRVPTQNVSVCDLSINLKIEVNGNQILKILENASSKYPDVIGINKESLVSSDFRGIDQSCVIDINKIKIVKDKFLKIVAWYDNEWSYAKRVIDVSKWVADRSK
jgi:glyceraldehyde 3-phosphate dehydrogenase